MCHVLCNCSSCSLTSWHRAAHLAQLWVHWPVQLWSLQHRDPDPACCVCTGWSPQPLPSFPKRPGQAAGAWTGVKGPSGACPRSSCAPDSVWEGGLLPAGERVAGLGPVHLATRDCCPEPGGWSHARPVMEQELWEVPAAQLSELPVRPPSQEPTFGLSCVQLPRGVGGWRESGCKLNAIKWKLDLFSQFSTLHDSPSHAEGNPSSFHDSCWRLWVSPRPLSAFTSFCPPPPPPAQGPHSPWSCDAPCTFSPGALTPCGPPALHLGPCTIPTCGRGLPGSVHPALPSASLLTHHTFSRALLLLDGGHTIICPSFVSSAGRKPSEICPAPEWCVARGSLGEYLLNEWMSPWDGGSRSVYRRVLVGGQWCFRLKEDAEGTGRA